MCARSRRWTGSILVLVSHLFPSRLVYFKLIATLCLNRCSLGLVVDQIPAPECVTDVSPVITRLELGIPTPSS